MLPKYKLAIFVHGCFWHRHVGCKRDTTPKTRAAFWAEKFERNVERDSRNEAALQAMGWRVLTIWECEVKVPETLLSKLSSVLKIPSHGEFSADQDSGE